MRKYPFIMVAIICLLAVPMAAVEADWHTELVDSNGGTGKHVSQWIWRILRTSQSRDKL